MHCRTFFVLSLICSRDHSLPTEADLQTAEEQCLIVTALLPGAS